jgi:hypothetical protein
LAYGFFLEPVGMLLGWRFLRAAIAYVRNEPVNQCEPLHETL